VSSAKREHDCQQARLWRRQAELHRRQVVDYMFQLAILATQHPDWQIRLGPPSSPTTPEIHPDQRPAA